MVYIIDGYKVGVDPRHITAYHCRDDCRGLNGSEHVIEVPKDEAEQRDLDPCDYCIGDIEYEDTVCPLCGEIVRDTKLPEHIRYDCDGSDDTAVSD